jgi:DNA replication initiation complex subunit (GINS family)
MAMSQSTNYFYSYLKKKLEEERSKKELLELNSDFYNFIREILKSQEKKPVKIEDKIDNLEKKFAKYALRIILKERLKKINNYFETGILNPSVVEMLKNLENKIIKKQAEKMTLLYVISKENIPEFLAPDGYYYGPFKEGDIIFIPEDITNILINKKLALRMDKDEST